MKYVVIIADGAADKPLDQLGGQTPLQAARTPNIDQLAAIGRVGTALTTPDGFTAGSDVCSMCLLGYDPRKYHTGRAPLEAAALGLDLRAKDWIFRVNLVTLGEDGTPDEGLMLDHSAGAISSAEARPLVEGLYDYWRTSEPSLCADLKLTPGVAYRNILVDSSANDASRTSSPRDYASVEVFPPHEIPRRPWREHLPMAMEGSGGAGSAAATVMNRLMELSRVYLPTHPLNAARVKAGKRSANAAWIWGQGVKPDLPSFESRFGIKGAMTTAVDLLAGISALIGWDRLDVPGATSYHDNDYAGQGRATIEAIERYDIVCCHVEAPDEASHQGDAKTKVAAIEAIDREVVGPVMKALERYGDPAVDRAAEGWRLLVLPDHYTLVSTRKHDDTPVPFVMAGAWVRSAVKRAYTEAAVDASDLRVSPGDELMEYFLRGGLVSTGPRTR